MTNAKNGTRRILPTLDDDPFLRQVGGNAGSVADDSDSIFSMSDKPVSRAVGEQIADGPSQAMSGTASAARIAAEPVEDPVLDALLEHGVLSPAQMAEVQARLRTNPMEAPPWRVTLTLSEVSAEQILIVAAHVNEIPFVDLASSSRAMLLTTVKSLPPDFMRRCREVDVLPFSCEFDSETNALVLKMAASDPFRPDVGPFMQSLGMEARLYFAPESALKEAAAGLDLG